MMDPRPQPSPTRVLFLEMDAGDKLLVRRWAAEGVLPNFARLFERGLSGDTMSLDGLFVGSIWPSFYTAVNPARHGVHSLVQLRPGSYEFFRCTTAENLKREPFWNVLSRAGKRVAILDVPLSGISEDINGIQSVEWGSHDANYGFRAWPPSFEADVRKRFGLHPFTESCNAIGRTPADFARFRDRLIEGVRAKSALTRHYLRSGGWDFFAQVFTESHCVGHQCWHLHDDTYPGHDARVAEQLGDPMRDVYIAIDQAIGEVIAEAGPETIVIVLCGHRMSHKRGAQFLLPEILAGLGVAVLSEAPSPARASTLDSVLTWAWQQIPGALKNRLRTTRNRVRDWLDGRFSDTVSALSVSRLNAARSHCFLMDAGFPVSGLRLNLAGREPAGLLQPGNEADTFCEQLGQDLLALENADTGARMIKSVKRTRDLYAGEYLDLLPDLLVEWSDDVMLGSAACGNPAGSHLRIRSDKLGVVEGTIQYCRTGDHRPEGVFVACGPGIAPGTLARTVSIMDFAPTFAALLDVKLDDVDGKPIAELLARAN